MTGTMWPRTDNYRPLGRLEAVLDALPIDLLGLAEGGTLVVVAAEHPVARLGTTVNPRLLIADRLAVLRNGDSAGAIAALAAGLTVSVYETSARDRQGDLVNHDAMSPRDLSRLLHEGEVVGSEAADDGVVCIGDLAVGNQPVAAALTCAALGLDTDSVLGVDDHGDSGSYDRTHEVVYTAVARARAERPATLDDPIVPLGVLGGPDVAFLTGVVLGAARAGAPIVLDGLLTSLAALFAVRCEPGVRDYLVAGHRSREHAHDLVLAELGLQPLLDLQVDGDEGVGACLAARMLLTVLSARRAARRSADVR